MRRLATAVLFLALAAPAAAKEMVRAEVCGADRCIKLAANEDLWPQAMAQPPAHPQGFVYLKYVMRPREGTHQLAVVGDVVQNDDGGWMLLTPTGAARVRRAARKVEPLPVAKLGLPEEEEEVVAAAREPAVKEGGISPVPFVAVAAAIALLAITARRRGTR